MTAMSELKIDFCQDLRNMVEVFQGRHANLSLPQISKKINVSYPTLKRVMNLTANPSLEVVTNILMNTGHHDQLPLYLQRMNPALASAFNSYFSHNIETPSLDIDSSALFANKDYLFILLLSFTNSGTTELEIRQEFGVLGIKRLQELIDHGILVQKNERIFGQSSKVTFNQKIMKQAVIHSIEQSYEPELFGKGENWLSLQTESINKAKAMPEIRNILQNAYKDIKEILYSDDYQGDDKVFVSMVADKILSSDPNQGILQ
jgi:hypothetical protein